MDNFGYSNWNDSASPSYMDTSDDYGQYGRGKSKASAVGSKNKSYGNSDSAYDFEISNDSFDASPDYKTTSSSRNRRASTGAVSGSTTSRYGNNMRRSSVDERAREILERNRKTEPPPGADAVDETRLKSFQDTYAELMEGLELPDGKKEIGSTGPYTPHSNKSPGFRSPRTNSSLESPLGTGDSFEISAADLEVSNIPLFSMSILDCCSTCSDSF